MLTARDRWQDKVEGLQAGADDYVAKPFHFEEVLARLQALLRRAGGWASAELHCGPIVLDTRAQTVQLNGAPVELTTFEYRILEHLMLRAGDVISKTELTERLYDQDFERDSNVIEVLIGRLRRKLDPARYAAADRDAARARLSLRAGARCGHVRSAGASRIADALLKPAAADRGLRAAGAVLRGDDAGAGQRLPRPVRALAATNCWMRRWWR